MDANEKRRVFKEMKAQKQNRLNEEVSEDYTSSEDTSPITGTINNEFNDTPSDSIQTIQYSSDLKYVGTLDNNESPSGEGTMYFSDGARLEGTWEDGAPVHGTYYYADGDRYEGDFDKDCQSSGQGTFYFANGGRIEGTWYEDIPVHGTRYFADGGRYEGEFDVDWKSSGQGTAYFSDGEKFEGTWEDGNPTHGTWFNADGNRYEGDFDEEWERSGQGTMYFSDGEKFEGTWEDGNPVHGTWFYADGNKYEGDFDEEWNRSGQGTMYYAVGAKIEGQWEADSIVQARNKPYLMPVEGVFSITGRGTVAAGRIETGVVKVGDEVQILGLGEEKKAVVTGVEMFRKLLDEGEAGDDVGLLLRGIDKAEIKRGMVITHSGVITPHKRFKATIYVLKEDEGGRNTPFKNKYRPQFYLRTMDCTGEITLPEGVEMVNPGDNVEIYVELDYPTALNTGLRFAIREDDRTVGAGQITEVYD